MICIVFTTLQTSYLLLFTVALTCDKKSTGYANFYFPDKGMRGGWMGGGRRCG